MMGIGGKLGRNRAIRRDDRPLGRIIGRGGLCRNAH